MPCRKSLAARILLTALETRECPATFTVTNTDDNGGTNPAVGAGTGTLRQAIIDANAMAGIDTIAFNIPGPGVQVIRPAAGLPLFFEAAVIDGYTQPGSSVNTLATGDDAKLLVEIDGNGTANLVAFGPVGDPSVFTGMAVRGLSLVNFSGTVIDDGTGVQNFVVEGNFFGVLPDGVTQRSNGGNVFLLGSGHRIGGDTPAARNILSGSRGNGLDLLASQSAVRGNYIGTDATGQTAVSNAVNGIVVRGNENTIGGLNDGARNVISGNGGDGIFFTGAGGSSANNQIVGNFIGVGVDGMTAVQNTQNGISQTAVSGVNFIGGTDPAARNVISGNGQSGIELGGSDQEVRGNYIGTDVTGTVAVPNNLHGVYVTGTNHKIAGNVISGNLGDGIHFELQAAHGAGTVVTANKIGTDATGTAPLGNVGRGVFGGNQVTVGGTAPGAGNTIAFNGLQGVEVPSSGIGSAFGMQVLGNSVFDNGGLGIDLTGVFLEGIGAPTLTRVLHTPTGLRVSGRYQNTAAVYRVEFFASPQADPSGFGEGKFFLGTTTATADAAGLITFTTDLPNPPAGSNVITATVTNQATGQTSEFSNASPERSLVAVGNESGVVQLNDAETGNSVLVDFRPLDSGGVQYTGLISVALGDVTGDGKSDLIVAPVSPLGDKNLAADKAGRLFVYDGAKLAALPDGGDPNTAFLYSRQPFGENYTNGLNIATGDVDGDGRLDIIVGTRGSSGGIGNPEQGRFLAIGAGEEGSSSAGQIGTSTNAFGNGYQKGCVVNAADLDGDGKDEVVVTRGGPVVSGSDLKVKAFSLAGDGIFTLVPGTEIVPFLGIKRGGKVTGLDTDADGRFEFVISALDPTTNKVLVKVFDGAGTQQAFFPVPADPTPGEVADFAVGNVDLDQDGRQELAAILDSVTAEDEIAYLAALTGVRVAGLSPFALIPGGVNLDGF